MEIEPTTYNDKSCELNILIDSSFRIIMLIFPPHRFTLLSTLNFNLLNNENKNTRVNLLRMCLVFKIFKSTLFDKVVYMAILLTPTMRCAFPKYDTIQQSITFGIYTGHCGSSPPLMPHKSFSRSQFVGVD